MAILKDIVAITGKYTDSQGQEKNRYVKIGVIMETRNGQAIKIEAIPVGWDGFAYLNDPKGKTTDAPRQSTVDDDVPF